MTGSLPAMLDIDWAIQHGQSLLAVVLLRHLSKVLVNERLELEDSVTFLRLS